MTHRIYVTLDMLYIMGRLVDSDNNVIEKPLLITLLEDEVIHFSTFDIFNKSSKIKISNFITYYEAIEGIIEEYENLINESEEKRKQFENKPILKLCTTSDKTEEKNDN